MNLSAHTLRVQILDREGKCLAPGFGFGSECDLHDLVRQLEQQVKNILDDIAVDESRKRELIRGDAVDKAEQLSELGQTCTVTCAC